MGWQESPAVWEVPANERNALVKVFKGLIDYTIEHFQTEERYFEELSYPETNAHKKEQAEGALVISFELLDFLYDWLMKHTSESEVKFRIFLDRRDLR